MFYAPPLHLHFNSHTHVEYDPEQQPIEAVTAISTHTLTWSTTSRMGQLAEAINISTHTLTWSTTWTPKRYSRT